MPRNRGRASAAASFFGFHARGRQRAEDRHDEREPEGRRAAAPEHGDDGVPEDERFSRRCNAADDDDYMQYDRDEDEGMPESRRRARRAKRAEEDGYRRYEDEEGGSDARADAEDGDPDEADEDRQDREGRRARRATSRARADDGDEDDDDAEMRGSSPAAAARRRERARCEAILTSRAAAANPELALSLAFETTMTRQEALRTLARAPAAPASGGRSARNPNIGAGGERSASSAQAIQAGWDRAFVKAGAIKPQADSGWDRAFAGQR